MEYLSGFVSHTWVNAGATASAAVILLSNNYFPPNGESQLVSTVDQSSKK